MNKHIKQKNVVRGQAEEKSDAHTRALNNQHGPVVGSKVKSFKSEES
jgi:hypothetical protein